MSLFFASDYHFRHANIIKYCNRPFNSVDEMNEALVANWNSVVTDADTVYFIGDLSMSFNAGKEFAPRLNGKKIIILGNHDEAFPKKSDPTRKLRQPGRYLQIGFSEVHLQLFLPLTLNGKNYNVQLCHFPFIPPAEENPNPHDLRYLDFRPEDKGQILFHGHVHQHYLKKGRQINFSCDVWNFTPVSIPQIEKVIADERDFIGSYTDLPH